MDFEGSMPTKLKMIDNLEPSFVIPCMQGYEPQHDSHVSCQKGDLLQVYAIENLDFPQWCFAKNQTSKEIGWCPRSIFTEEEDISSKSKTTWFRKPSKSLQVTQMRSRSFSAPSKALKKKTPWKADSEKEFDSSESFSFSVDRSQNFKGSSENYQISSEKQSSVFSILSHSSKKSPSPIFAFSNPDKKISDTPPSHMTNSPSILASGSRSSGDLEIHDAKESVLIWISPADEKYNTGGKGTTSSEHQESAEPTVSFGTVPNRIWSESGMAYVTDDKKKRPSINTEDIGNGETSFSRTNESAILSKKMKAVSLLDSERIFLFEFRTLVETYIRPIQRRSFVSSDLDIQKLFAATEEICGLHQEFLKLLERKIEKEHAVDIGESLLRMCKFFNIYNEYYKSYDNSLNKLNDLIESNKSLKAFLETVIEPNNSKTNMFITMLSLPLKRQMEYPKYIKDIMSYIGTSSNLEQESMKKCLDIFEKYANQAKSIIKLCSDKDRLKEIENSFAEKINLSDRDRQLVRRDMFCHMKENHKKPTYLLLFSDCLIIAFKDWKDKLHILRKAHFNNICIYSIEDKTEKKQTLFEVMFNVPALNTKLSQTDKSQSGSTATDKTGNESNFDLMFLGDEAYLFTTGTTELRDSWINSYRNASHQKIGIKNYHYTELGEVKAEVIAIAGDAEKPEVWSQEILKVQRRKSDGGFVKSKKNWNRRSIAEGIIDKLNTTSSKDDLDDDFFLKHETITLSDINNPSYQSSSCSSYSFNSITKEDQLHLQELESRLTKQYETVSEYQRIQSTQLAKFRDLRQDTSNIISLLSNAEIKRELSFVMNEIKTMLEEVETIHQNQARTLDFYQQSVLNTEREKNNVQQQQLHISNPESLKQALNEIETKVDNLEDMSSSVEPDVTAAQHLLDSIDTNLTKLKKSCLEPSRELPTCLTRVKRLRNELKACNAARVELKKEIQRLNMTQVSEKEYFQEWKNKARDQDIELECLNKQLYQTKQTLLALRDHLEKAESDVRRLKPLELVVQSLQQQVENDRIELHSLAVSLDNANKDKEMAFKKLQEIEQQQHNQGTYLSSNSLQPPLEHTKKAEIESATAEVETEYNIELQSAQSELKNAQRNSCNLKKRISQLSERLESYTTLDEQFHELRLDMKKMQWNVATLEQEKEEQCKTIELITDENSILNEAFLVIYDICRQTGQVDLKEDLQQDGNFDVEKVIDGVRALSNSAKELKSELDKGEKRLKEYEGFYKIGKEELKSTGKAFYELESKYKTELKQQNEEILGLHGQLDDNYQQISYLQKEVEGLEKEIKTQLVLKKEYSDKLTEALENLKELSGLHKELVKNHEEMKKESITLMVDNKHLTNQNLHFSQKLKNLESSYESLNVNHKKLAEEYNQLAALHSSTMEKASQWSSNEPLLKRALEDLKDVHEKTLKDVSSLSVSNEVLRLDYKTLQDIASNLRKEKADLEEKLSLMTQENSNLSKKIEDLSTIIETNEKNRKLSNNELNHLREEKSHLEQLHSNVIVELKSLEQSYSQMMKTLILTRVEKQTIQKDYSKFQKLQRGLDQNVKEMSTKLEELSKENETLRASNLFISQKISNLEEMKKSKEDISDDEISKVKQYYEQEINRGRERYKELEKSLSAMGKIHVNLERDYQIMLEKRKALEGELSNTLQEKNQREKALQELKSAHEASENERANLKSQAQSLQYTNEMYQAVTAQKEHLEREYNNIIAKYENLQSLADSLQHDKTEHEDKIQQLHIKVGEISMQYQELYSGYLALSKENEELKAHSAHFSRLLDETQQQYFSLKLEKESYKSHILQLEERKNEDGEKIKDFQGDIGEKNKELKDAYSQISKMTTALKTKESLLQELEERLHDTNVILEERALLKSSMQTLQNELASAKLTIEKLQTDKGDILSAVESLNLKKCNSTTTSTFNGYHLPRASSVERLKSAVSMLTERKRSLQKMVLEPEELNQVVNAISLQSHPRTSKHL